MLYFHQFDTPWPGDTITAWRGHVCVGHIICPQPGYHVRYQLCMGQEPSYGSGVASSEPPKRLPNGEWVGIEAFAAAVEEAKERLRGAFKTFVEVEMGLMIPGVSAVPRQHQSRVEPMIAEFQRLKASKDVEDFVRGDFYIRTKATLIAQGDRDGAQKIQSAAQLRYSDLRAEEAAKETAKQGEVA